MDKTSIKPNYFNEFENLKALHDAKSNVVKKDPDQEALKGLVNNRGWDVFVKRKDELLQELDDQIIALMAEGANYEVIGQKTVIKEILKDIIRRLFNKVEDATQSE